MNNDDRDQLFAEAIHLQAMEGNPMTDDEIAMFKMFDREGLTPQQQRQYILENTETE